MPPMTILVSGVTTDGTDLTIDSQVRVEGSVDYLPTSATVPIGSDAATCNAAIRAAAIVSAEDAQFVIDPGDPKTLFAGAIDL